MGGQNNRLYKLINSATKQTLEVQNGFVSEKCKLFEKMISASESHARPLSVKAINQSDSPSDNSGSKTTRAASNTAVTATPQKSPSLVNDATKKQSTTFVVDKLKVISKPRISDTYINLINGEQGQAENENAVGKPAQKNQSQQSGNGNPLQAKLVAEINKSEPDNSNIQIPPLSGDALLSHRMAIEGFTGVNPDTSNSQEMFWSQLWEMSDKAIEDETSETALTDNFKAYIQRRANGSQNKKESHGVHGISTTLMKKRPAANYAETMKPLYSRENKPHQVPNLINPPLNDNASDAKQATSSQHGSTIPATRVTARENSSHLTDNASQEATGVKEPAQASAMISTNATLPQMSEGLVRQTMQERQEVQNIVEEQETQCADFYKEVYLQKTSPSDFSSEMRNAGKTTTVKRGKPVTKTNKNVPAIKSSLDMNIPPHEKEKKAELNFTPIAIRTSSRPDLSLSATESSAVRPSSSPALTEDSPHASASASANLETATPSSRIFPEYSHFEVTPNSVYTATRHLDQISPDKLTHVLKKVGAEIKKEQNLIDNLDKILAPLTKAKQYNPVSSQQNRVLSSDEEKICDELTSRKKTIILHTSDLQEMEQELIFHKVKHSQIKPFNRLQRNYLKLIEKHTESLKKVIESCDKNIHDIFDETYPEVNQKTDACQKLLTLYITKEAEKQIDTATTQVYAFFDNLRSNNKDSNHIPTDGEIKTAIRKTLNETISTTLQNIFTEDFKHKHTEHLNTLFKYAEDNDIKVDIENEDVDETKIEKIYEVLTDEQRKAVTPKIWSAISGSVVQNQLESAVTSSDNFLVSNPLIDFSFVNKKIKSPKDEQIQLNQAFLTLENARATAYSNYWKVFDTHQPEHKQGQSLPNGSFHRLGLKDHPAELKAELADKIRNAAFKQIENYLSHPGLKLNQEVIDEIRDKPGQSSSLEEYIKNRINLIANPDTIHAAVVDLKNKKPVFVEPKQNNERLIK